MRKKIQSRLNAAEAERGKRAVPAALAAALERDASSAWAHSTIGLLRRQQNRLPELKIELETAIALDRNYANAFSQLGITLVFLGQQGRTAVVGFRKRSVAIDNQAT